MSAESVPARLELLNLRWGVQLTPLGAGGEFATEECSEGVDAVLWHLAVGDEVEFFMNQDFVPPTKSIGGNTSTSFSWNPEAAIYNRMGGEDEDDADEGILVGFHVCLSEHPNTVENENPPNPNDALEERVFVLDSSWESDYPSFDLLGEYRRAETVGYRVERDWRVSDGSPGVQDVLTPLADLGVTTGPQPEQAVTDDGGDDGGDAGGPPQDDGPPQSPPPDDEQGQPPPTTSTPEPPGPRSGEGGGDGGGDAGSRERRSGSSQVGSTVSVGQAQNVEINVFKNRDGPDGIDRVEVGIDSPEAIESIREDIRSGMEKRMEQMAGEAQAGTVERTAEEAESGAQSEPEPEPTDAPPAPDDEQDASEESGEDALAQIARDVTEREQQMAEEEETPSSPSPGGELPPEGDIEAIARYAEANWDLSGDYTDYSSDCLSHYDAATCGDVWQRLKEKDAIGGGGSGNEDAGGGSETPPPDDSPLSREYVAGQSVLLTRPGCPDCKEAKQDPSIQQGLASGELIEVEKGDPDFDFIVADAGVAEVPAVVMADPEQGFVQV